MANAIQPGDQVFVATPMPAGGGNVPLQPMGATAGPGRPIVINSEPARSPGQFLLNGVFVFRLGITTVVFGSTILISGICCAVFFGTLVFNEAAPGVWGGFFIVVAGSLSIASGIRPRHRALNISNLTFHIWALCNCIACLALFGLNLEYFSICKRQYWFWGNNYLFDSNCPDKRHLAITVYSVMAAFICIQMGISIAIIVFCCKAFPACKGGNCCGEDCCGGQCDGTKANHIFQPHQQFYPHNFHTGYATVSPNVQPIQSGQILYMMTPVAVTTQHPQNVPANQIPQATLVMA